MCGIVGVFGNIGVTERKIFQQLLQVDVLRGKHSTGIIGTNKGTPMTYKKALSATEFLELSKATSIISSSDHVLIGHNRHATMGAVTDTNAHPFTHGNITLVHNGTLTEQWQLPESRNFEVDSENICYAVNKLGAKEAFENTVGAFCCVWHDASNNTLNMVRNDERPMWYVSNAKGDVLFFSSERELLLAVMVRNNYEFKGDYKEYFTELPLCSIHTFSFDNKVQLAAPVKFIENIGTSSWKGWSYHGSSKSTSNTYTPPSNKPEDSLLFKRTGLKPGDIVPVTFGVDAFVPYSYSKDKPNPTGNIIGTLDIPPYNKIKVQHVLQPKSKHCTVRLSQLDLTMPQNAGLGPNSDKGAWMVSSYVIIEDSVQKKVTCDNCGMDTDDYLESQGLKLCDTCVKHDEQLNDILDLFTSETQHG